MTPTTVTVAMMPTRTRMAIRTPATVAPTLSLTSGSVIVHIAVSACEERANIRVSKMHVLCQSYDCT